MHCQQAAGLSARAVACIAAVLLSATSSIPVSAISDDGGQVQHLAPWDSVVPYQRVDYDKPLTGATVQATRLLAVTTADVKEAAADAKVAATSKGGELTKQAVALAKDAKEVAADAKVVATSKSGELTKQAVALAKDAKEVAADAKVVAASKGGELTKQAVALAKDAKEVAADAKASKGGELAKQAVALAKDAKEVAADAKVVAAAQAKQVATSAGDLGKEAARRTELTALKIDELKEMAAKKSIVPEGDKRFRETWITALLDAK